MTDENSFDFQDERVFDSIEHYGNKLDTELAHYFNFLDSGIVDPEKANKDGMKDMIREWRTTNREFLEKYYKLTGGDICRI